MIDGKEVVAGGFNVGAQVRGLVDLLEAHYAECAAAGRPWDPAVVARIGQRIAAAGEFIEQEARE